MQKRKKLWLIASILAGLWVGLVFVPILCGVAFPPPDFSEIVRALEAHGEAPPQAAAYVNQWVREAGPLQRAVPVGYYAGVEATFQLGASRSIKKMQMSYVAWFRDIHKPVLFVVERYDSSSGERTYAIGEGEIASVIRAMGLPPLLFIFFLYMTLREVPKTSGPSA